MRNLVVAFIFGALLSGIPASIYAVKSSSVKKPEVLAENTQEAPSPTPSLAPTPTSSPSPSPTPKPTAKPTLKPSPSPTPLPQPVLTSAQISALVDRFAGQYAVDANVLRHIAICESGFKQFAENAGYAGLFQFGPITWKNIRLEIGEDINPDLRYNAEEAVQTAAYALSQGKTKIWPNCAL